MEGILNLTVWKEALRLNLRCYHRICRAGLSKITKSLKVFVRSLCLQFASCDTDVCDNCKFKMKVLWDVTPCSLLDSFQHFRGLCCLHNQDKQ
jgi:hypothetical protein